jgi:hypothetical protein
LEGRMAMYQRAGGKPLAVAAAALCYQLRAPGHAHPAAQRSTLPPWNAPRDAIAYITAAGLEPQPLTSNESSSIVNLKITLKTSRSWSTRSTQLPPECV